MTNSIFELENGRQYLVVKTGNYNNKMYALLMEVNAEKDEVIDDSLLLKEVKIDDESVTFENVSAAISLEIVRNFINE